MARRRGILLAACLAALVVAAPAADLPPDAIHVLELPDGWQYSPVAAPPSLDRLPERWDRAGLPHRMGTEACGVYRLRLPVPAAWARRRVTLVIRHRGATVWAWLNGAALGVRAPTALNVRLDASGAIRHGMANDLLVAVGQEAGSLDPGGLEACWLEATGAVSVDRLDAIAWALEGSALVDVRATVANHTGERFEGKLELALEPAVRDPKRHPVWRRGSDVRLDPGRSAEICHTYEIAPPRLWRPDDPFLYRLTATVKTREGKAVLVMERPLGVTSLKAASGRWHVNGEWTRLGGIALEAPGASLLCPQAGQAAKLASRLAVVPRPTLRELLAFCDKRGIVALLDAPGCEETWPGWREAMDDLAAVASRHPCVWGWVVAGELEAQRRTLGHLRERTPRIPIGCLAPDLAEDARGFDFVLSRYATRAVRHDNDDYHRRLEDLKRTFDGLPVVCIDQIEPAEPGDLKSVADSLNRRRGEAARRWPIAMLFFQAEPDPKVFALIESRLRSKHLKPPRHGARLDKGQIVVKSRFEGTIASPVAQRMPCSSLVGYRLVWRAGHAAKPIAGGTIELPAIRPRPIEGGGPSFRQEVEWRTKEAGDFGVSVELQDAAGRVVAAHRSTLTLKKTQDGKVELKVGPARPEEPPPPPPTAKPALRPDLLVTLDLSKAFNNDGISSQANIADGNLDLPKLKSGDSYPADQLPKPGDFAPKTLKAVRFRFPDHADGKPNNLACNGQRLDMPKGTYEKLWLLAAAEFGNQEGTGRLVYDKGEEPFALRVTDWCEARPAFGEIEAVRCTHRHTWDGQREEKACRIWAVAVPLREQPLQAIVLPKQPRIHIFAATLVRAATIEAAHVRAIEGFFNNDGISWRAGPKDGNFDLPGRRNGDTFIADLLPKAGAAVPVPGQPEVTFRFPTKENRRRNNVVCGGQRIHLPEEQQTGWDAAWFLGACHDGAQRAVVTIQYETGPDGKGELRLADWCSKPTAGEIDVLRTTARHIEDGSEEKIDCGLTAWRIALDPKRKLLSITLPRNAQMHVFALTLTRTRIVGNAR